MSPQDSGKESKGTGRCLLDRTVERNQRELEVSTVYHFVGLTKNAKFHKPVENKPVEKRQSGI